MNVETDQPGSATVCPGSSPASSSVADEKCPTDQGMMDPSLLYEPPFTDIAPTGPEQVFDEDRVTKLVRRIREISDSAVARLAAVAVGGRD